jgi:hypothetical protein
MTQPKQVIVELAPNEVLELTVVTVLGKHQFKKSLVLQGHNDVEAQRGYIELDRMRYHDDPEGDKYIFQPVKCSDDICTPVGKPFVWYFDIMDEAFSLQEDLIQK